MLIINADDFGMSPIINRSVKELYLKRAISQASILAPASATSEASAIACEIGLPVSVHWTLHSEWDDKLWKSSASSDAVSSLLEGGFLRCSQEAQAKRAMSNEVSAELEAQLEFLIANGCAPASADCHGKLIYGDFGRTFILIALDLCRKHDLAFRFPRKAHFWRENLGGRLPARLWAVIKLIAALAQFRHIRIPDECITDPRPALDIKGYEDLKGYYLDAVSNAGDGVTEIFLHPCKHFDELSARGPYWLKREWEYRLLMEGCLLKAAKDKGFTITSWKSLKGEQSGFSA
jgi:predicted glycoside hydrolase/deacetylase ChbG (UPF0249 family)